MRLEEIRQRIRESSRGDWRFISDGDGSPVRDAHYALLVFRDDVRLSIAWGAEGPSEQWPSWAETFQAHLSESRWRSLSYLFGDVYWEGSLVDRYLLAPVEGVILPVPAPAFDHHAADAPERHEVFSFHLEMAQLINSIQHKDGDFTDSFRRTGAKVINEEC